MIRSRIGLVLVVVIVVSGCGGDPGDDLSAPGGDGYPMYRKIISHALELTVEQRLADDTVSDSVWQARVDEVVFQVDEVVTPDVTFRYTPKAVGDTVRLYDYGEYGDEQLHVGDRIVAVTLEVDPGDGSGPALAIFAAYEADTMRPLTPSNPSDLAVLTVEADPSASDMRAALGAFLKDAYAYQAAERAGELSPPVGTYLAPAWETVGYSPDAGTQSDERIDSIGMTAAEYIAADAAQRQLLSPPDLGAEIVGALDLVPLRVVVFGVDALAGRYWAVGARSQTGTVGPAVIDGRHQIIELIGSIGRNDSFSLVGWVGGSVDPSVALADAETITVPQAIDVIDPGTSGSVVIDLGAGTSEVVTDAEADARIDALLSPDTQEAVADEE